ncbi:MAG: Retron-type reverse transcriptase [Gammaproteobacteria bacterium]|nr:Retron-type reverse transcriptase [Gammaproteobacteria bacterium]
MFILRQLLEESTYRPSLVRRFNINRADGGKRLLSALTLKDKFAQRLVLQAIEPLCEQEFHPASFGYRPGRNRYQARDAANSYIRSGLHWVVDADIHSFFDHIPHKPLLKTIANTVRDKKIVTLNRAWLDINATPRFMLQSKKGIPQGGILSPLWCNLYLNQLDQCFANQNIPFVRYADDFLMFCNEKAQAEMLLEQVSGKLLQLDLKLNPNKTRIAHSKKAISYLGLTLCEF